MLQRKVILVVIICLGVLGTTALPAWANELGDAVKKQKSITQQKNQVQGQLNQLTFTADQIKNQIAQLETQIAEAQRLLAEKQVAHEQAQKEVTLAQQELEQKQKEFEGRQDALGKRVKGIYECGQVSYLELLFQSTDLSDFITRIEYCAKLVSNDRQLLLDLKAQKEQIEKKMLELQKKRNQAAMLEAEAALAKTNLEQMSAQQLAVLEQNKKEQQAAFDNIERLESEANALNQKIRKLQTTTQVSRSSANGSIKVWPVPGYYQVSSSYGRRIHPITQKRSLHTGIDIVAPAGTQIRTVGAGVVIMTGWNNAYGNMTIIDHGQGLSTLYAHQSALNVTSGQAVQANQIIGYVGSTGWSTGPHLHFEVRVGGNPTNPLQYLR